MRLFSRRAAGLAPVCAAAALAIAACGSSSNSSASSTAAAGSGGSTTSSAGASATSSGVAAAKKAVAARSSIPSGIPITTQLKSKPPKETVAWLEPQVPAGTVITPGFRSATAALGWDLKVIPTNPLQPGTSMQQAIDEHVNFIGISGESEALYAPQLKKAQAAGIPVMSCYDDTPQTGSLTGHGPYFQCGGTSTAQNSGAFLADWATADSNGKANVVVFNIPTYPNLVTQVNAFKAQFAKVCPGCSFASQNVSLDQLSKGQIPQIVSSFLQSNPKYKYIYFTFSNPPTGVAAALKGSGLLSGRKIFGLDFNGDRLQGIISGEEAAWTGLPKQYSAWLMVDAMARVAEHMSIGPDVKAQTLPQILVDTPARAKQFVAAGSWAGPTGFEQDFGKLWHVG